MTDLMIVDAEFEPVETDEEIARREELERLRAIDVAPLKRMVDSFRDGTEDGRNYAVKSRKYFDGDQLDGPKLLALKRARQPRVIRNEITPAVNGLLGIVQQGKVDPKAHPRNPGNEKQADVASKALRFVSDSNRLHTIKVNLAEDHFVEGAWGVMVEAADNGDPMITQVPYEDLIYDPHSRDALFKDARFKGLGRWHYESKLAAMYPDFADDFDNVFASGWAGAMGLDREDQPENAATGYWIDKKSRRLFVVELYHEDDGTWMRSVFVAGRVLEHGPSPYLDEEGEPMCAAVFGSCYITRTRQRCGVVKAMLSPQDELNAYASRALHLANSRQLQIASVDQPPEVDAKTASVEAAKADGVMPWGYQMVPTTDLLMSIQGMMADARQAIVRQAPTPAVLAEASAANQSGRSRLVLQQAGMTEIARALGRLEDGENEIQRHCWLVLKQFKTEPWWVRTSGDDSKGAGFEGLNQPMGPDGKPMDPRMAAMMAQAGQPVQISNKLADMDVDIEVESIPDTANLQAEQFEAFAPLMPQVAEAYGVKKALEVGLALSSMPGKADIKAMLEDQGDDNPQAAQMAQMQQQMQQMAAQLAEMKAKADLAETASKTALNEAKIREIDAGIIKDAADMTERAMNGQGGLPPTYNPLF